MITSFPEIVVENVCVDYPIPTVRDVSLKHTAFSAIQKVGGQVIRGRSLSVVRSLDNVSFHLQRGDRLGLIGPNGAGKTTLIRLLSGVYAPTSGSVSVSGKQIPLFDIGLGFDIEATGYENIYLRGLIMGLSAKEIAAKTDDIAAFSELGSYLSMPVRTYSAGMTLRLMFAIATAVEGDIVIMDEWIVVGDAAFREKANRRLRAITDKSGILIIASHDVSLLRGLCNLGLRLEKGRVAAFGPIEEVLAPAGSSGEGAHARNG